MNIQMPDSIATFFAVSNGADISAVAQCFAATAVVSDEAHMHQGHEPIRAWLLEAQRKYAYTAEPLDIVHRNSAFTVRARVSGNFPGSPVELKHVFRLADGKIEV